MGALRRKWLITYVNGIDIKKATIKKYCWYWFRIINKNSILEVKRMMYQTQRRTLAKYRAENIYLTVFEEQKSVQYVWNMVYVE